MTVTVPAPQAARAEQTGDPQQAAIDHGTGPALVLAAPGSGKTYVITRRFVRLVREGVALPGQILVLAYNRRAADELQRRVEAELGPIDGDSPITTYHAWAQALVRRHGWHLGWPETLRIASDAERWIHLAGALEEVRPRALYNPARPFDAVRDVKTHVERCKQELVTPEEYLRFTAERQAAARTEEERAEAGRYRDLAAVYARLQERYSAAGLVDHDDGIAMAGRLLREVAAVREACARLLHVMVDEFQDTNSAQAMLLEQLVAPHRNVMAVADDDQAIYRFRGASRLNIHRFRAQFPEAREIRLLVNRRSTPQIISFAQSVIDRAASREAKVAVPARADGEPVRLVWAAHARDEAAAVVEEVQERLAAGCRPSDIAVLTQFRADVEVIADGLRAADIPYVTTGGRDFFRAPEIKAVMALLEVIGDPDAGQALQRCLHLPAVAVGAQGRLAITRASRDAETPLVDLMLARAVPGLDEADAGAAVRLAETVLDLHSMTQTQDVRDVFAEAMLRTGFARLGDLDRLIERQQFAANVSRFYEILDEYCTAVGDVRFETALQYLQLMREAGAEGVAPIDDVGEGVVLSTIHSAKGLEWRHVVVAVAVQGRMPSPSRPEAFSLPSGLLSDIVDDPQSHREEQRRLFYVALTRARDSLTVTWAKRYGGRARESQRSEFLMGADHDAVLQRGQPFTPLRPARRRRLPDLRREGALTLSYSAIDAFRRCPRQFEYRQLWRMTPVFSPDGWYGDLLHRTLKRAGELRAAGREVAPSLIDELWTAEWNGAGGPKGRLSHLREEGRERLREYVSSPLWREGNPSWIEHSFSLVVEPGQGWQLAGRIDRLDTHADGVPEVIDYKTGRPGGDTLERNLQLKVYGIVAATTLGADEVRCSIHWLQTATSATIVRPREKLAGFLWAIEQDFGEIEQAHAAGHFPARPGAWQCSRCPYRVICPERADA